MPITSPPRPRPTRRRSRKQTSQWTGGCDTAPTNSCAGRKIHTTNPGPGEGRQAQQKDETKCSCYFFNTFQVQFGCEVATHKVSGNHFLRDRFLLATLSFGITAARVEDTTRRWIGGAGYLTLQLDTV